MTTIFYETFPVAHLTFDSEWQLDYDPSWEARRSAFPVSLTALFFQITMKDHRAFLGSGWAGLMAGLPSLFPRGHTNGAILPSYVHSSSNNY